MESVEGFIVAAWEQGGRLFATGRLVDGRSFALARPAGGGALLLGAADREAARPLLEALGASEDPEPWSDMAGRPLVSWTLPASARFRVERALAAAGIRPAALRRAGAEEALGELNIMGSVSISGNARPGRAVDLVFSDPVVGPSSASPALRWLALDIETDRGGGVLAVSLVHAAAGAAATPGGAATSSGDFPPGEVLFLLPPGGAAPAESGVSSFATEAELLAAFAERFRARDPDVVTGWNIVDFDLRVLAERFTLLGLPFALGRGDAPARLAERAGGRLVPELPGRAVIDALRLLRASGERHDDMSLETVARDILGEGKSVGSRGEDKLAELDRLYREEPGAFCAYCLRDAELVLRILGKTGLDLLTARRAALTGLSLELAWTSVPAFERVYAAGLRARRVAVPEREARQVSGAAGGTVLEPRAGLFEGVLVFDFRSLYPSLMRSFNIDPLAYARAAARPAAAADILAPNGARFDREPGILPAAIARYTAEREAALARGDDTAAYVYKILMNSFYGVLGAESCRYARTELAGAITSFGKLFLHRARDFFEARGWRCLYGDTDSVFVESGLGAAAPAAALLARGGRLAEELNGELAAFVEKEYRLPSHLRIRCEKLYSRFYIPRLRLESAAGGEGRGRAKGYAGLLMGGKEPVVEVKGMEAARSDWTPLARRFQTELLGLLFGAASGGREPATEEEVRAWCAEFLLALRAGRLDAELVYRKSLRRPAGDYASETPQVRAARLLGWVGEKGSLRYLMTKAGAEPLGRESGSPPDYDHYVEKQLLPIARSACDAAGWDAGPWFADRPQLELGF